MNLRPYQKHALDETLAAFDDGCVVAIVEMPTGTGKTVFFAALGHARDWGKVLVLAHRRELIEQACEKIEAVTGDKPDIEMAEEYAPTMASDLFLSSKYVVGSVQTMTKDRRLKRFDFSEFGLIVIDEGHHARARSYTKIIDHIRKKNPRAKFLLVSATFDRSDGKRFGKILSSCGVPAADQHGDNSGMAGASKAEVRKY